MRPQSLMHAACVLGLIFQQTRNKIPQRSMTLLYLNQQTRSAPQFPREFSSNFLKFDSSAPSEKTRARHLPQLHQIQQYVTQQHKSGRK